MPYSDPEKAKARRQTPEYKAKKAAYDKKYREDPENKEKAKQHMKIYNQSPAGRKATRIYDWKRTGVICDDFDALYERYLNTELCELCSVELSIDKTTTSTTRCLDHDHNTGLFRNVVCNSCNVKIG